MSKLRLNYGGYSYLDRTWALESGRIVPTGIDLNYIHVSSIGELFRLMAQFTDFDAGEMSLCTYMMMRSRGDDRLTAIPVFPSRSFRHGAVYVNAAAGIARPEDLRGRSVGVFEYQMTAALWVRAFLEHDHGVEPRSVSWLTGPLYDETYAERMPHEAPLGVRITRIADGKALVAMLESGELDALVTVTPPRPFMEGRATVRRLFPDYRQVEEEYFRRTSFFPIMHVVVVKTSVYQANPWVAASLYEAFLEAKLLGYERLRQLGALAVALPWLGDHLDDVRRLFAGDAFPYGLPKNRAIVTAMAQYALEQGLLARPVTLEELFAAETLEDPAIG